MLTKNEAIEIANAWHSVMTWSDPGVVMYSLSSTGKIHNEKHRQQLIQYINTNIMSAKQQDEDGDPGVVMGTNEADLEALKEWVKAYKL